MSERNGSAKSRLLDILLNAQTPIQLWKLTWQVNQRCSDGAPRTSEAALSARLRELRAALIAWGVGDIEKSYDDRTGHAPGYKLVTFTGKLLSSRQVALLIVADQKGKEDEKI